jgi:hypothetical protein
VVPYYLPQSTGTAGTTGTTTSTADSNAIAVVGTPMEVPQ